jgi:hypothetical protein
VHNKGNKEQNEVGRRISAHSSSHGRLTSRVYKGLKKQPQKAIQFLNGKII